MKLRERILKHIVEEYSTEIYFMVKKDETLMEVVISWKIRIGEMGYEVDEIIVDAYAKMHIDALADESKKIIWDCKAKKKLKLKQNLIKRRERGSREK